MPKSFLIAQKRASKRKRDARPTDDEAGSKKRLLKPQNITGKLYDSESRVPPIIPLERLHIVTKTLPETTSIPQHRPPSPTAQHGPYGMPLPAPKLGAVPEYSQQSCSPEYDSLTGRYHDHSGLITQNKDHRQIFAHFPSDNITVYKSENPEAMCTQSHKKIGYGDSPCTTASPKVAISKDESHTADDSGYKTSCSLYSPLTSSDDDVSAADDNDEHVDEVNERQRAPTSSPYITDVHGLDFSSSSSSSSSSLTYAATPKDTGEEIIECSDSDISVGDEDTSFTCEPKYTKALVESDMAITYSQHLENVIRGSLEPSRLTNRQPLQPIVITPQCSGNSRYEDRHQSSRKRICYDNIPLNSPDAPKGPLVSPVFGQPTIHNYHDPRFWLETPSTPLYSNMGVSYPAIYPSLDRYRTYPFSYPRSRSSELVHNLHSRYQKHPVEQKHGFEFMPHLNVPRHELRCAVSPAEKPNNISHSITNLLSSPELSDTATSPKSTTPLNMDNQLGRLMDDYPQYACPDCKKSYSSHSGLAKHRQQKCLPDEKKRFTCKHCSKVYTSLGALKMHIRTHTLPCKCHICGKAFSRPWLLQGHIRTHTGEKPFSCQHCNRSFADRSNLRAHLQTHTEVKKYSCKKCTKTFSRMSLLLKHDDGGCSG